MFKWKTNNWKFGVGYTCYVGKWPVGTVFYDGMTQRNATKFWVGKTTLPLIKLTDKHYETKEQAMALVQAATRYWFKESGLPLPLKRRKRVIGIIGTRRRDSDFDFRMVENEFLRHYHSGDSICSGLCPKGGDRFAVLLAEKYGCNTIWHKANWEQHGKSAGFVRNAYIAEDSNILIACVAQDRKGGTEDTIRRFKKRGKNKIYLV